MSEKPKPPFNCTSPFLKACAEAVLIASTLPKSNNIFFIIFSVKLLFFLRSKDFIHKPFEGVEINGVGKTNPLGIPYAV